MKIPTCHPDKALKAKGLCSTCYSHVVAKRPIHRRKKVMGLMRLGEGLPELPDPQHRVFGIPRACHKCHAPQNSLICEDGRCRCMICGWDAVVLVT